MGFALTQLELDRGSRRRGVYAYRYIILALACGIVLFFARITEQPGGAIAEAILALQLLVAFVLPPLIIVPPLQQEKRERTLELLVLAEETGYDLALSRFVSGFLTALLVLLSSLPALAAASVLGGISVPDAAVRLVQEIAWLAACCALSLLAALWSGAGTKGLQKAYSCITFGVALPAILLPHAGLSPLVTTVLQTGGSLVVAAVAIVLAPRRLRQSAFGELDSPLLRLKAPVRRYPVAYCGERVAVAETFLRIAMRKADTTRGMASAALFAACVLAPMSWFLLPGAVAVQGIALYHNLNYLRTLRRIGVLEELAVTSYTEEEVHEALRRLLNRTSRAFAPSLLIALFGPLGLLAYRIGLGGAAAVLLFVLLVVLATPIVRAQAKFVAEASYGVFLTRGTRGRQLGDGLAQIALAHFFVLVCTAFAMAVSAAATSSLGGLSVVALACTPIFVPTALYRAFARLCRDNVNVPYPQGLLANETESAEHETT